MKYIACFMPWCPEGEHVKGTSCLHHRLLYGSGPTASMAFPTPHLTSLPPVALEVHGLLPWGPAGLQPAPSGSPALLPSTRKPGRSVHFCFAPFTLWQFSWFKPCPLRCKRKTRVAHDQCLTFLPMHFIPGSFKLLSIQPSH